MARLCLGVGDRGGLGVPADNRWSTGQKYVMYKPVHLSASSLSRGQAIYQFTSYHLLFYSYFVINSNNYIHIVLSSF